MYICPRLSPVAGGGYHSTLHAKLNMIWKAWNARSFAWNHGWMQVMIQTTSLLFPLPSNLVICFFNFRITDEEHRQAIGQPNVLVQFLIIG